MDRTAVGALYEQHKNGIFRYGKDRYHTAPRPGFASDALVSACSTEDGISVTVSQAMADDIVPRYYIIELKNEQGETVYTQTEHTDFYNLSIGKQQADSMTFSLKSVPSGTYTVHVFAANDFFAHNDQSISCTLSV